VTAVAALDHAVAKGVLHRNNAARRKARVMKRLNATEKAPVPAPAKPAATRAAAKSPRTRKPAAKR
jgi:hypothetical protein